MTTHEKKCAIEAMLFVAGEPVPITELASVLDVTALELMPLISQLEEEYEKGMRGMQLLQFEEKVQLVTNKAYSEYIERLLQPAKSKPFSQSMLETLAIIAYKQPVTRSEIEEIRGVRCEYSVAQLLSLGLICDAGRKPTVGRPVLLATTDEFLRRFGLRSLAELPSSAQLAQPQSEEEIVV